MRPLLVFLSLLIIPMSVYARPATLGDGYLGTRGSQIVDSHGQPVRIAAIGWNGADGRGNVPQGLDSVSLRHTVQQMAAAGFNTVRIPFSDRMFSGYPAYDAIDRLRNPDLIGLNALEVLDKVVRAAGAVGLRVILDHHNNEGGPAPLRLGGRQLNGLWFDRGAGSTGEDSGVGSGNPGGVTAEIFQAHWVALARRYANNPTVIGFDLHNEPAAGPKGNGINWGKGGPTDLQAMCTTVGTAIQAVNPDVLIICEGYQDFASGYPEGDLRGVATKPVVLPVPNKVVYSVHEFPTEISHFTPASGAAAIRRMNRAWGYLITEDIAPVFVGEMGSSMLTAESAAWAKTMVEYLNGTAPEGIRLARWQVPVSAGWWVWGDLTGEMPQGVLRGGWEPWMNKFRPEQKAVWSQLQFDAQAKPIESATR
ncbi:MAG TPA: glycoside hydrolase [Acetobacteraceae bacterium]|jgi:endoglucanase|nr:glycoside hydrolase [Acetobacteraceae bacterium]